MIPEAQDQTAAVLRIRSLKPDATVGLVTPRDGTLLHQARYSLNYFDCVFIGGTGGFSDPILWKDLGREIGGVALTRDLFGMTGFSANADVPAVQNIVKELREHGGLKMQVGQAAIRGPKGPVSFSRYSSSLARPTRSGLWKHSKRSTFPLEVPI